MSRTKLKNCDFSDFTSFQPIRKETGLFTKQASPRRSMAQDAQQNWMWIARAVSKESTETERTEKELSIIVGSFLNLDEFQDIV